MTGFMGIISKNHQIKNNFDITINSVTQRIENIIVIGNCWFKRSIINKFVDDKLFIENSGFFICIEGIILNANSLMNILKVRDIFDLIVCLYNKHPSNFPLYLRGDFSGAIYDKNKDIWIIFNNHLGTKPIFYYFHEIEADFVFASELQMVVKGMRAIRSNTNLSEIGAYCLLSFGYMIGDLTLVEGVKKLSPGSILKFQNGSINTHQYYQLKNTPYIDLPNEEIIEELDLRFKNAIKAEYEKDLEYDYKHIATLSGGLDSRMNVCYAKKLCFSNILAICFSQSNYADEKIAKEIASQWGIGFLFSSLDNGNYLKEIERHVLVNDGLTFYSGAAHVFSMLNLIDWTSFGLLHTGQIGDLIMGSYLIGKNHHNVNETIIKKVATSTKLLKKIPNEILSSFTRNYYNDEIFAFYERCVNGVFNGYRTIEQFSEFSSPFLNIDFLEYAMRIHPKKRYKEKIYLEWIIKKAPESGNFIWEKTGYPITTCELKILLKNVLHHMRKKIAGPSSKDSMNPFDYWYITNKNLKNTFEEYFDINISLLNNFPNLKEDTHYLYIEGNTIEKTQVLTLLAAIKMHKLF